MMMTVTKIQILSFMLLVVAGSVSAAPMYTIVDMGTLGGTWSRAAGINDSGQVVGSSRIAGDSASHAFLYNGEAMVDLGTLGGPESSADDINNSGQIVGRSDLSVDNSIIRAFIYDGGSMIDLGNLEGGKSSYAYAINDRGQVVGYSHTDLGLGGFLYEDNVMSSLGTMGGDISIATDINNNGVVVGWGSPAFPASGIYAFLYDGISMENLGTLGGNRSNASAINDAGFVVGGGFLSLNSARHAFLYDGISMEDLGTLGGIYSYASDLNDSGQVVGSSQVAYGSLAPYHAFLYNKDEGMVNLNNLISPDTGWVLSDATGINSLGQVVGYGVIDGETHAYVMTPVPEPTTSLLFGVGFGFVRRRIRPGARILQ